MSFLNRELTDEKFTWIVLLFGFVALLENIPGWFFLLGVFLVSIFLAEEPKKKSRKKK